MIAECANPGCREPFVRNNGRCFRFRQGQCPGDRCPHTHSVELFWLCQVCSSEYTLTYDPARGVSLFREPAYLNKS
jgi:hypothetical protein